MNDINDYMNDINDFMNDINDFVNDIMSNKVIQILWKTTKREIKVVNPKAYLLFSKL